VKLTFGEIGERSREQDTVQVNITGDVRMSPQHAKRLVKIMLRQLELYERKFGEIPQPKD
jgi:hypothetical protein